jgi:amidase
MMADELWGWSARAIADAIRGRKVSSREVVTSALARLEAVNPRINAVVDILAEEALSAADRADAAVAGGEATGPLHGVPVTAKINVDYSGRATTNGVPAFRERVASADSPPIANWRKAGAIFIGRTNVPPFSARFFTANELYGATLNPWSPAHTPGGSSGGAAAAVATGIGALAHGNDRAGSIRYPAYACGVAGLRPTFGRVPTFEATNPQEPSITTQLTHVQGPLARSIADLRLGLAAMAMPDPRDPWYVMAPRETREDSMPVRVALVTDVPGSNVDSAVLGALHEAAAWLTDAGYVVEEATPPHFEEAARLFFTLVRSEEAAGATKAIQALGDDALRRARASTMAYASELDYYGYIAAFARRSQILREWLVLLERFPLLLMPVSCEPPFPVDYDQQGDAAVARMLTAHHPMLAVSMLGLPGLSVPTGLSDGVPIGVQIVAGRFREELCLRAGEVIEARQALRTPVTPMD